MRLVTTAWHFTSHGVETHPSFADDEEGVAACALADDVLSLFVGGLRKVMFKTFCSGILG